MLERANDLMPPELMPGGTKKITSNIFTLPVHLISQVCWKIAYWLCRVVSLQNYLFITAKYGGPPGKWFYRNDKNGEEKSRLVLFGSLQCSEEKNVTE